MIRGALENMRAILKWGIFHHYGTRKLRKILKIFE